MAVCLLAAGAAIIVLAGVSVLRSHQMRQAEQQLRGYAGQLISHPFLLTPLSRSAPGPRGLSGLATAGGGALSIEVRGSGGELVIRTGPGQPAGSGLHAAAAEVLGSRGRPAAVQVTRHGSYLAIAEPVRYRAHRIPYAYSAEDFALDVTSPAGTGSPGTLVVGVSLAGTGQADGRLAVVLLALSGLVVLAAGGLAAWLIRIAFGPVARLRQRAEAITAGGPRPGPPGPADPAVAPALSALLTQLEQAPAPAAEPGAGTRRAAAQLRRALADTGRELRRPLSVLGGLTEYYRHRDQLTPGEFDHLLARVADETSRMGAIIEDRLRPGPDEPAPPA